MRINTFNNKYTFIVEDLGYIKILRYGEEWLNLRQGQNAVFDLLLEIEGLRENQKPLPPLDTSEVIPKGTEVVLCCCSHDLYSDKYEDFTLDQDYTSNELDEIARGFMEDKLTPEWYWKYKGE